MDGKYLIVFFFFFSIDGVSGGKDGGGRSKCGDWN